MIEVHDLSRLYGEFVAVDGVSFEVGDREIVGILGPNGAGKTTTLRMITGFLPPTAGRVVVAGHDLRQASLAARRQIGYLPENVALYPEMRVREYLAYRARLQGIGRRQARQLIGETLERCLIDDVAGQIIGTLSKGYRQRVGLATAILHQPSVLVLDEPTVGLDPKQIIAIRELIRDLGRERTLLLSTHILPEVELLCQRVLIIDGGRLVDQGTPAELRQRWHGNARLRVAFEAAAGAADAAEALAGLDGALAVRADGDGRFQLEHEPRTDLRAAVFHLAVERGLVLIELAEEKASLEDVFVRLTTHDAAGDAPTAGPATAPAAASTDDEEVDS